MVWIARDHWVHLLQPLHQQGHPQQCAHFQMASEDAERLQPEGCDQWFYVQVETGDKMMGSSASSAS